MSIFDGISKSINNTPDISEVGIGGFSLFARVRESVSYRNIVPTDTLEDGTNAADDIINEPITITIEGVVSDVFIEDRSFPEVVEKDLSSVGEITSLLPAKSQQQAQRLSQVNSQVRDAQLQAESAERIANNSYEFLNGSKSTVKDAQEKFIDFIESIYFARNPIDVSVKYRDYRNMAITSLDINRDNQSGDTVFSINFQQIDFTTLVFSVVQSPSKALSGKVSDASNKGGQNPESNDSVERSLLSNLIGG